MSLPRSICIIFVTLSIIVFMPARSDSEPLSKYTSPDISSSYSSDMVVSEKREKNTTIITITPKDDKLIYSQVTIIRDNISPQEWLDNFRKDHKSFCKQKGIVVSAPDWDLGDTQCYIGGKKLNSKRMFCLVKGPMITGTDSFAFKLNNLTIALIPIYKIKHSHHAERYFKIITDPIQ